MKIDNPDLIAAYRRYGPCRVCRKPCNLCAHHIWSKGAGQVDIPTNLIALGANALVDCQCHVSNHDGNKPLFEDLLAASAADHKCPQGDIEDVVMLIRRMPKIEDMTVQRYTDIVMRELMPSARTLAMRELETFAHLLGRRK